jgi:hypothetical protein
MASTIEEGQPDWNSVISAWVFSCDETIFLVSKEGTKFPVNQHIATDCSPYFQGLLTSGMLEAGKSAGWITYRSYFSVVYVVHQ